MRKFLMGAAALAAVAVSVPANAAERCQGAMQQWSSTPMYWNSRRAHDDATQEIRAAQDEMRRGSEDRCLRHIDRAFRIAREDGADRRSARDDRRYSDRRYDDRYDRRDDRRTEGSGGGIGDILRGLSR